jgi:hypothetical protein
MGDTEANQRRDFLFCSGILANSAGTLSYTTSAL